MVNIAEAKAKLSEYVEAVGRGGTGHHLQAQPARRRAAGDRGRADGPRDLSPMFPGETFMTDAFFEPMTRRRAAEWYGPDVFPAKVAESRATMRAAGTKPKRNPRS